MSPICCDLEPINFVKEPKTKSGTPRINKRYHERILQMNSTDYPEYLTTDARVLDYYSPEFVVDSQDVLESENPN